MEKDNPSELLYMCRMGDVHAQYRLFAQYEGLLTSLVNQTIQVYPPVRTIKMIYYRKHVLVYLLRYIVIEKIIKPALKPSCVSSQREEFGMSCDNFQRLDEMKVLMYWR